MSLFEKIQELALGAHTKGTLSVFEDRNYLMRMWPQFWGSRRKDETLSETSVLLALCLILRAEPKLKKILHSKKDLYAHLKDTHPELLYRVVNPMFDKSQNISMAAALLASEIDYTQQQIEEQNK